MRRIEVAEGPELYVYEAKVRFVTTYELPMGVSTGAVQRAIAAPNANMVVLELTDVTS